MSTQHDKAVELTAKLSLEQKVALLTGRDFWNTVPLESIGLRNLLLSDGSQNYVDEFNTQERNHYPPHPI